MMSDALTRVLLVDDDEEDALLIRELMSDIQTTHYQLSWAPSFAKGMELFGAQHFDVILVDFRLGDSTGIEVLKALMERGYEGPIIFLTGINDSVVDNQVLRMGAADYLIKAEITAPLLDRSIRYAIAQAQNIQELKQRELHQIRQERLATAGLFASSLAHEIGTPLGVIRGRAEYIEMLSESQPEIQKNAHVIVQQIDRVAKLIQSLLAFARGGTSHAMTAVHVRDVTESVMNLMQPDLAKRKIDVRLDFKSETLVQAEADGLQQVLLNLLVNSMHAIEAVSNEERARIIRLTTQDLGSVLEIAIHDTGIGITTENLKNIFKPFFTTKDVGKGTGLGLAVVYQLVTSWQGTIQVESQSDKGTTFRIHLKKANRE